MLRLCRLVTVGLLVCHVAACSSLSVEERAAACAQTDWERFGENDGRLGVATEARARRFADCTDLGHPVDLGSYQTGRTRGLETYCTAENGYEVGYDGRIYARVCPPSMEPDFLQGYEQGRRDRPGLAIWPGVGIGIGTGGVRTRVGIGVGLFSGYYGHQHCTLDRYCW